MASKTTNYGLNKHSPQDFYNVEARNENWDKIDEALAATDPTKITAKAAPADGDGVMIADSADGGKARLLWSNVKAALGKLFVPLARKINGKALAKDVTLTGDDIAMGADDAETLRAAMAKRLRYDDNLGLKIKLKAHKSLEYMSFDSGEETDLNYSGGCLALPGWRSGPWGMQLRYDMRWNTLFTRRYFNEGSEWDDWVACLLRYMSCRLLQAGRDLTRPVVTTRPKRVLLSSALPLEQHKVFECPQRWRHCQRVFARLPIWKYRQSSRVRVGL